MKSRILFISPVNPCIPYSGFQYRTTNVLNLLLKQHKVDLLFLGSEKDDSGWHIPGSAFHQWQAVAPPSQGWWRLLKTVLDPLPYHVSKLRVPEMEALVDEWCLENHYAMIFLNKSHLFPLVHQWSDTIPVVIDQHAAEPDVWDNLIHKDPRRYFRWYARFNRPKVMSFERKIRTRIAGEIAITDRDRSITLKNFQATNVVVAPQGVDFEYYAPDPSQSPDPLCLIFSGTDASRNVDSIRYYLEHIHPFVVQSGLAPRLLWIGNVRSDRVRFLTGRKDVELTGFVPDTPPYFDRGMLAIAPFRMGEGMKTKVVEAMAKGKVIVATSVAVQGIAADGLPFIKVADDPQQFAGHVVDFLRKPDEMVRLGKEARLYARKLYTWERTLAPMMTLINEVIDNGKASDHARELWLTR